MKRYNKKFSLVTENADNFHLLLCYATPRKLRTMSELRLSFADSGIAYSTRKRNINNMKLEGIFINCLMARKYFHLLMQASLQYDFAVPLIQKVGLNS